MVLTHAFDPSSYEFYQHVDTLCSHAPFFFFSFNLLVVFFIFLGDFFAAFAFCAYGLDGVSGWALEHG